MTGKPGTTPVSAGQDHRVHGYNYPEGQFRTLCGLDEWSIPDGDSYTNARDWITCPTCLAPKAVAE